ncbi:hypothetical protein POSPLADRAFT_1063147 [Postia placenta MAD-698-R-SB12]|uniref:Uncharacterized protein n=1 Tax=Postia placenta MAD-698-R-SB12 TaxID=670580 RepID=A0A1X6MHV0_9APHY|nr:hypothetical protein POSPLADRAFT_1063147 [Postia placenta MAD-698-R-SB12]OSX55984.1 hypothetical protein POSPLADRAFT_1063147 [Postia placenta MAD-698-R-SB12]
MYIQVLATQTSIPQPAALPLDTPLALAPHSPAPAHRARSPRSRRSCPTSVRARSCAPSHPIQTDIPFVTTLSTPSASISPSSNRAIIAGSVVGVAAFIVLSLAMAVCYRRHQQKKPIFFCRSRPLPRNMLLAGEDMDDYDLGPPMSSYRDTPGTGSAPSLASHATSYNAGSLQGVPLVPPAPFADPGRVSYSPHLMGMRTSESGSIFHEAVWPPPRSALVDPLLVSSEDLSHIVDDVMGPANPSGGDSSPGSGAGAVRFPGSVATAGQATHARAPSEDPLMGGALESPSHSPRAPTWCSPLSVTNMGSETASVRTAASPPPGAWSRFSQGQSRPSHDDEGGTYAMCEAL